MPVDVKFLEASVKTALDAVSPEKVIVPEDVIPVAAAIAPDELTWNCEEDPAERRDEGVVVPMPTFVPSWYRLEVEVQAVPS